MSGVSGPRAGGWTPGRQDARSRTKSNVTESRRCVDQGDSDECCRFYRSLFVRCDRSTGQQSESTPEASQRMNLVAYRPRVCSAQGPAGLYSSMSRGRVAASRLRSSRARGRARSRGTRGAAATRTGDSRRRYGTEEKCTVHATRSNKRKRRQNKGVDRSEPDPSRAWCCGQRIGAAGSDTRASERASERTLRA